MDGGIRIRLRDQEFAFSPGSVVKIGRGPENNISSDNPLVSRCHAELRQRGDQWMIEDTNSKRGTFIDGRKITRAVISGPSPVWLAEPGQGQLLLLLPGGSDTAPPTGIFLNYRRGDAAGHAGRLYDRLSAVFGEAQLFRDIDTVTPGTDFLDRIERAVGSCKVFIAVIGPHWLGITDDNGRRRLDRSNDLVRREIEAALLRPSVRVIPVLVDGAAMPSPKALPPAIQELAYRQAIELSDERFNFDFSRLSQTIKVTIEP